MSTLVERAKEVARHEGMSLVKFQEVLGLSNAHFYNTQKLSRKVTRVIEEKFPHIDTFWLSTGEGCMLKGQVPKAQTDGYIVPLLPVAAQGQISDDIQTLTEGFECEKILSPIKDVTLAVTINGDSMSPEYPNGSKVFVQRIDNNSFIEWGCAYLLDTINGVVIKNVVPVPDNDEQIICRSVNPNFSEFRIRVSDIRGWYRVRCCLTIK